MKINIWRILGVISLLAVCYLFFNVIVYLTIALVLFLITYPITYRLEKIKLGTKKLPDTIAAIITILIIITVFVGLFFLIIPPLINEINLLSTLNFYDVLHNCLEQFPSIKNLLLKLGGEAELKKNMAAQATSITQQINVSSLLNNVTKYLGTFIGGTLCVLFITFFFLKDELIVKQSILLITPNSAESEMKDIMRTSKKMLSNYFAALFLDMFIVGTLIFTALSILGIKNALLIAFLAGILNIIPYVGSATTMVLAIFLGASGCISAGTYELIGPTINKLFFTLLSVNLLDGFLIQPYIFSNSVKAHPLEIFIVTLMAGTLGGILGMIVALPVYTLLRIIAKEFLTHLKFFKKISDTIEE